MSRRGKEIFFLDLERDRREEADLVADRRMELVRLTMESVGELAREE